MTVPLATCLLALVLNAGVASAQGLEAPAGQSVVAMPGSAGAVQLLIVLKNSRDGEPDVAKEGGHVDYRDAKRNILVVTLPESAAEGVRAHKNVKYTQRLVLDDPQHRVRVTPTEPTEPAPMRTSADAFRTAVTTGTTPWSTGVYQYDGSGNITSIGTDTGLSSRGTKNQYVYDPLGRLVVATSTNAPTPRNETYAYDAFGNMTLRTTNTTVQWIGAANPATNQMPGTYDIAGNMTFSGLDSFTYDPFNMVATHTTASGATTKYVYTAGDERIGTLQDSGAGSIPLSSWSWTLRDESGKVLREYQSQDLPPFLGLVPTWLWIEDYAYRDGQLAGTERVPEEGGRRHFTLDHLGTPRVVTSTGGVAVGLHDYYPFGQELTSASQDPLLGFDREEPMNFTGHQRDFTDARPNQNASYFDYMHARYYSYLNGRFLSVDPTLDVKKAIVNPQGWNRYSYVMNNPLNRIDPDGRADIGLDCVPASVCTPAVKAAVRDAQGQALKMSAVAAAAYVLGRFAPSAGRALLSWAIGNSNQATHVAEALLSPPGPSSSVGLPAVAKYLPTAERVGSALKTDTGHRAAAFGYDAVAEAGQSFELKGGDGVVRTLIQAPNKSGGIFEYIINPAGQVTHERFIPDAVVTGLPNQ